MVERDSLSVFIMGWAKEAIEFPGGGGRRAYLPHGRTGRQLPDGPDLREAGLKQDGYQPQIR